MELKVPTRVQMMLRRAAGVVERGLANGAIGGGVIWTSMNSLPTAFENRRQTDAQAHEFVEWVRTNIGEPIEN